MPAGSLMVCAEHHQQLTDELERHGRTLSTSQGNPGRYLVRSPQAVFASR